MSDQNRIVCRRSFKGPVKINRRLVFGEDTEAKVLAEFGSDNPMVVAAGRGPAGQTCSNCVWLEHHSQSAHWLKCGKQKNTRGVNPDHKASFDACALFEKAEDGYQGGQKRIRHW